MIALAPGGRGGGFSSLTWSGSNAGWPPSSAGLLPGARCCRRSSGRRLPASSSADPLSSSSLPQTTSVGMVKASSQPMNASSKLSRSSAAAMRSTCWLFMNWIDSQCGSPRWTWSNNCDRFEEESLAPLPVAQPLEARAAEDRAARAQPLAHALDRRSRAQRKPAEVELGQIQTRNQLAQVAGENAFRDNSQARAACR